MTFRPFATLAEYARNNTGSVLKWLVWLFCGLLLLGTWLFVAQQVRFERQQAIDEAVSQNVNRVIAFEQYVQRTLEVAALSTRYVADRFERGEPGAEFLGTPERPALMRGNFARGRSTFTAVAITNAQGDVIATSRRLPGPFSIASFEAFRVHLRRNSSTLYVSWPVRSPLLGRNVIFLSRRLNHPDGSFAGVMTLAILPEQFTGFYRDARIGPNDVMALIGLDGITRARRTGDIASSGEDLRGRLVMQMQMRNPNGTYLGPSSLDGAVRYFSHRRLTDYPLFATYGILQSEVLALPRARAVVLIATAALISLVSIAFAALFTLLINRGERRGREAMDEKSRLEEAQRLAKLGDWHLDMRTGETRWSPVMYELFERDPTLGPPTVEEYRGWLTEESIVTADRALREVMESAVSREFEVAVRVPSGEACHQIGAIPLHDKQGRIVGIRGTTQDVSGRKLIEGLQARVAQLSRIDAMNAMATTLAHELNQPLAAAANFLSGSRRKLAGHAAPEAEEGLAAAEQQIHFAGNIIRRVREMVSNKSRATTDFGLAEAIDDAIALAAAGAGGQPSIKRQLAADARRVHADRVQVQQVLINLIRNADAATAGRARPKIAISSRLDGPMVVIAVTDNGVGFSQPSNLRFSSFASGKEGGMGLGLSISRTIVEGNGGRIWTEDPAGGGACVCFTLPAARPARSRAGPAPAAELEEAPRE